MTLYDGREDVLTKEEQDRIYETYRNREGYSDISAQLAVMHADKYDWETLVMIETAHKLLAMASTRGVGYSRVRQAGIDLALDETAMAVIECGKMDAQELQDDKIMDH